MDNGITILIKMKNKKYHTVGTVPKFNKKIAERGKIDTLKTQIHYHSLSWLGTFRLSLKCINHTIDLKYLLTRTQVFYSYNNSVRL